MMNESSRKKHQDRSVPSDITNNLILPCAYFSDDTTYLVGNGITIGSVGGKRLAQG